MKHEATLISGQVTCSCGWVSKRSTLASDAVGEWQTHRLLARRTPPVDRIAVNIAVTDIAQQFGITLTEADDDDLNELTHHVADFLDERRS